jgi:hypothetical protein
VAINEVVNHDILYILCCDVINKLLFVCLQQVAQSVVRDKNKS